MLGLPGAEAAAGAAAHTPSGGAPSGPSAGAAQGGTAGAAAGGAAMAGLAAAGAAAVGNSYVDNLGKAGIKEVREQTLPNTCHLTLCSAFSAHASLRATLQASAVGGRPAALCLLTTYAPPLHILPCRCGMPCSCTATMSQCWCCCTRRSPPGRATCAKRCGRLGLQQVKASALVAAKHVAGMGALLWCSCWAMLCEPHTSSTLSPTAACCRPLPLCAEGHVCADCAVAQPDAQAPPQDLGRGTAALRWDRCCCCCCCCRDGGGGAAAAALVTLFAWLLLPCAFAASPHSLPVIVLLRSCGDQLLPTCS